ASGTSVSVVWSSAGAQTAPVGQPMFVSVSVLTTGPSRELPFLGTTGPPWSFCFAGVLAGWSPAAPLGLVTRADPSAVLNATAKGERATTHDTTRKDRGRYRIRGCSECSPGPGNCQGGEMTKSSRPLVPGNGLGPLVAAPGPDAPTAGPPPGLK